VNLAGGVLLVAIGVLMLSGLWNAWMLQLGSVIGGYVTVL
jgi:cytochrome c-type biogenesis protein